MAALTLIVLQDTFAVCKLGVELAIPEWATRGAFSSATRTADELSIVCREQDVPVDVNSDRGWKCLRVAGQLDFLLVGVLASMLQPLADAAIPVFVLSTFGTDYLLVRAADLERAGSALRAAGHRFTSDADTHTS